MKNPRVAIVCDWLVGVGGAERVVLELHKMFPDAPIYTSQYDPHSIDWFYDADIKTTWLQNLPTGLRKFLPYLRQQAFKKLDLSSYDLVISSSGAEAKFVKTGPNTTHICYCHAPTHYYWQRYNDYLKEPGFGVFNPIARLGLKLFVKPLRKRDYKAAQKPDIIIANSTYTKNQIKKYYNRESLVVFPPVNTNKFKTTSKAKRNGFVVVGRQTPYKRIDLAVTACTALNIPLTVVGDGPEHSNLKKQAGPSVTLVGQAKYQDVINYLQSSEGFIFPGIDDFGIAAVEALAAGTPVIAYKDGGAMDYIHVGKNGMFFESQTSQSLQNALKKFRTKKFNHEFIAKTADNYNVQTFQKSIKKLISSINM